MKLLAESFDLMLVKFTMAREYVGDNAFTAKQRSEVLLPEVVGFHQFAQARFTAGIDADVAAIRCKARGSSAANS